MRSSRSWALCRAREPRPATLCPTTTCVAVGAASTGTTCSNVVSVSILLYQSVSCCISHYHVVPLSIVLYQLVSYCISRYRVLSVSIMLYQSVSCCIGQQVCISQYFLYQSVSCCISITLYRSASCCISQQHDVSVSIML